MRDVLPERMRAPTPDRADVLLIEVSPSLEQASLSMRKRRRLSSLGSVRLDDIDALRGVNARRGSLTDAVLRIPSHELLERETALPTAAEMDLDRVVAYEMDRLTPFTSDEVYWSAEITRRDRQRAQIMVRLSLLRRAVFEPLVARLQNAGVKLSALEVVDGGRVRRIALRHDLHAAGASRWSSVPIAGAAFLALAAAITPFLLTERAIARVEERIDGLRPAVAEAEGLRRKIAGNATGAGAIAAESARLGDVLQALATITDILPDDTYLTEFAFRQRRLSMGGESAAAPKLIGLLSADPTIRAPAFSAPITRSDTGQTDVFAIRAELGL